VRPALVYTAGPTAPCRARRYAQCTPMLSSLHTLAFEASRDGRPPASRHAHDIACFFPPGRFSQVCTTQRSLPGPRTGPASSAHSSALKTTGITPPGATGSANTADTKILAMAQEGPKSTQGPWGGLQKANGVIRRLRSVAAPQRIQDVLSLQSPRQPRVE
jgi:hypothetical protein